MNGTTQSTSTPSASISSALRAGSVSTAGCEPGRTTSAGCGSKVTTTDCTPSSRARATACPMVAWCPRCTPSKTPMVTTDRPQPPGAASYPRHRCIVRSVPSPFTRRTRRHSRPPLPRPGPVRRGASTISARARPSRSLTIAISPPSGPKTAYGPAMPDRVERPAVGEHLRLVGVGVPAREEPVGGRVERQVDHLGRALRQRSQGGRLGQGEAARRRYGAAR